MERLGKPQHRREGRRLSERAVSELNLVTELTANFAGCLDFARHDVAFYRIGYFRFVTNFNYFTAPKLQVT